MAFSTNSDLPTGVLESVPDGLLATFRQSLNEHLGSGCSETLAFIKAYRSLEDGGHVHKDGVWVAKDVLTTADVHVDVPIGSGKPGRRRKDDPGTDDPDLAEFEVEGEELATEGGVKKYAPPAEVIAAAKAAFAADKHFVTDSRDLTEVLAAGQGVTAGDIRKIAEHTTECAKWGGDHSQHCACGGPHAAKWAARVIRKYGIPEQDAEVIAKAGNGVMLAFWPDPELAKKLAVPGGEAADQLHLTLAYFGKLDDVGMDSLPTLERAVQQFAATHAPLKATLGGVGRFPATPQSDGQDVVYLGVHSPDIQKFRAELVAAVEGAGSTPKKDFGYTPHITLKMLPAHAPHLVSNPEPVDVTFDKIVLSIGTANKEYPLTGQEVAKSQSDPADFELRATIVYKQEDQQLMFGWASVVTVKGVLVTDSQGDRITAQDIEDTAYEYTLVSRKAGEMHEEIGVGRLIESCVFTSQKQTAMTQSLNSLPLLTNAGAVATMDLQCEAWWVGFRIDDPDVWAKIKTGEYSALSVGGFGKRKAIAA